MQKFRYNFQRLKEFMESVDKEIGSLAIFNEKEETFEDSMSKFSGITSIQQLKHLLKNYDGLVESQNHLLTQSINKMQKIPPPDEITATFNRFQVLKDSELDEFRSFIDSQKKHMATQYKEFEQEKNSFEEMNRRMESEKYKISEEREQLEQEIRRIREANSQLENQI